MKESLSVVMAVHNDAPFLDDAIQSILTQDLGVFEFVIIDDGSTDGSRDIVEGYRLQDTRIRVITQENIGLTASLRKGVAESTGDLIARMDGDDISLPNRLSRLTSYLNSDPACALVGGNCELIDTNGERIGDRRINPHDAHAAIKTRVIYQHGDVIFRRKAYDAVGGYRPGFRYAQDLDLWLRISEKYRIAKIADVTYRLRISPGMISSAKRAQQQRYAHIARRFAKERTSVGHDSYDEIEKLMVNASSQLSEDRSFGLVYVAVIRYRDRGKDAAREDLKSVLKSNAQTHWKFVAAVLLLLPRFCSSIIARFLRSLGS